MPSLIPKLDPQCQDALETVLGYLNFSSGAPDPQFLAALNRLYAAALEARWKKKDQAQPAWKLLGIWLASGLEKLTGATAAFGDTSQAAAVIRLVWDHALPGYRAFHSDLLFHQTDEVLFQPFFIGRVCEVVLAEGAPWSEHERIVSAAIRKLNDYVGHRPVPALQNHRHEPDPHEWLRPIPLYVEGAGVAAGRYHAVVVQALEIIRSTDSELLRAAQLNPQWLSELAIDPRAYDFEHPANKRPNYHFGQWDPNSIDNSGRYRRFVVQQVTLDALMERVEKPGEMSAEEALFEGGSVLAGTMLMSTGISGWGPEAHDSSVSLVTLLPRIAAYRDEFYEQLLEKMKGAHGRRLKSEAKRLKQPFGEARQHLNAALTRRRAAQMGHVQLAKLFARMGFPEAAQQHAEIVPAASARMLCQVDCLGSAAADALRRGTPAVTLDRLEEIMNLLRRGIACGAIIDPWTILGFDAHYSLFAAIENSIRDFRADELVELIEKILNLYAGVWCAAAAAHDVELSERVSRDFRRTARWWHQFAAHEVSSVDAPNAMDAYQAAEQVAQVLGEWQKAGAAGGAVAFWAPHAEQFDSPKAYAMVVEALLDRRDYVASMALLVHWLSRAEIAGLEQGESSFTRLAVRWLRQLQEDEQFTGENEVQRWKLIRRLFDYFEANAEQYGQAPKFEIGAPPPSNASSAANAGDSPEDEEEDSIYGAAYEDVVFRDSTDDGVDGAIFEYGRPSEDELEAESKRLNLRLGFLICLVQLWRLAAWERGENSSSPPDRRDVLLSWFRQAEQIYQGLDDLVQQVGAYRVALAGISPDSLIEFDRQRSIKEAMLERIIAARVEVALAAHFVLAAACAGDEVAGREFEWPVALPDEQRLAISLMAACLRGDSREAEARYDEFQESLRYVPLLYVPLGKGGRPDEIVSARMRQRTLQTLLEWLPRVGLLNEARRLIDTARCLERDHPVGPGAVTEFDDLFEVGYRAMVDSLITSSESWPKSNEHDDDSTLVTYLEQMTQAMIETWLAHSRTLRLSVMERVSDEKLWTQLVDFVKRYGHDLFTQQFLNLANLRAIQHQGVDAWLTRIEEEPEAEEFQLVGDLDKGVPRQMAVNLLSLILDAVSENYVEYRDYNATTTQSDRGELLYMLLDFIRLRVAYDRIAWNLRPVILAHETLVRRGRPHAAQLWRRALADRFQDEADKFLMRLDKLQKKYAMRMPTVADRLAERFVLPMTVDRLKALVEPAIRDRREANDMACFHLLEQEANVLARDCAGVGLDLPGWLVALEEEVDRARRPVYEPDDDQVLEGLLPQAPLAQEQVDELLQEWTRD